MMPLAPNPCRARAAVRLGSDHAKAQPSEASASAVKIAATAQRRSSGGKPSMGVGAGGFAVVSSDIRLGLSTPGAVAPTAASTTDAAQATGTPLHDAYAKGWPPRHIRAPTFGYLSVRRAID